MATAHSNKQLALGIIGGLVAAALGPPLWYGIYHNLQAPWMAPLLIGLMVGGLVRLAGGRARDMRPAIAACVLTVMSCVAGYVWAHLTQPWKPQFQPTILESVKFLLGDFFFVILIAAGTFFAYLITSPRLTQ